MDAKRWVWAWSAIAVYGGAEYGGENWWGMILVLFGGLMMGGNLRRLIPLSKLNTDQRNQLYGSLFSSDREKK